MPKENLFKKIENYLSQNGIEEAGAEARLIVKSLSGLSLEDIILGKVIENEAEIEAIAKKRVETRAPLQHLVGFAHFMEHKFFVDENVLIPRDETEILVRAAAKLQGKTVLDIGTGSGCIACSLAHLRPDIQVLGVDVSTPALTVAIKNALALGLENRAIFRKSDIFSNIRPSEKFDIIISNPPYIPVSQAENLQSEVRFDPSLALFASDDEGLEFYGKIISEAPRFLNPDGHILFEVGQYQAQKVKEMLLEKGFCDVEITPDLGGIERVVSARLN